MQNRKRKSEIIDERILPGKVVCEHYANDGTIKAFAVVCTAASGTTAMVRLYATVAEFNAMSGRYELQQEILLDPSLSAPGLQFADVSRLIVKDSVHLLAALDRAGMFPAQQLSGYDLQCITAHLQESRTISRDLKNTYLQ